MDKLIEFIDKELKALQTARRVAMTKTEQWLLDARIVDLQRILSEAYKIKEKEND